MDAIEAGFPVVSPGERKAIKKICKQGLKADICGLARTVKNDIDVAIDCDLKYIHTFIATSDIHLQYKLKMTRESSYGKCYICSRICQKTWSES